MISSPEWSREMPPFPERIGRYELLLPIASGGSATVYLARSIGLAGFEREVALKLTHAQLREDPAFAHALIQEATIAGRIRHPNVVPVLDVDEDPFGVYLVMEYVEGETLSGLAKLADAAGQRVPEPIALRIVSDVLDGLQTAHDLVDTDGTPLGLVHRDVTPHNVLVGVDGIARLTDFGIAKATARIGLTATGRIKGKVAYMSPEQALGKPLDAGCDLWAVGVILWELMTGSRLHVAESDAATLLRIVSEPPPLASTLRPDLPVQIDALIAHALQMNRYDRPHSAEAFAAELERAANATYGRATRREVASWVSWLVAERLAMRRAKIDEVIELRNRLGALGRVALGSSPSATPSAPYGFTVTDHAPGPDAMTRVDGLRPSVPPPRSAPDAAGETTRTETASVTSLRSVPSRSRSRARIASWIVVGTATAGVVGVAAMSMRHVDGAPGLAPSASSPVATVASASAPRASSSAVPVVEVGDLPFSPDELPLLPGKHPAVVARPHRVAPRVGPRPAAPVILDTAPPSPTTKPPQLLGSPYRTENE